MRIFFKCWWALTKQWLVTLKSEKPRMPGWIIYTLPFSTLSLLILYKHASLPKVTFFWCCQTRSKTVGNQTHTYTMIDTVLLVWRWWCVVGWTNRSQSGRKSPSPMNAATVARRDMNHNAPDFTVKYPKCSRYYCDTMWSLRPVSVNIIWRPNLKRWFLNETFTSTFHTLLPFFVSHTGTHKRGCTQFHSVQVKVIFLSPMSSVVSISSSL